MTEAGTILLMQCQTKNGSNFGLRISLNLIDMVIIPYFFQVLIHKSNLPKTRLINYENFGIQMHSRGFDMLVNIGWTSNKKMELFHFEILFYFY